jgi:hypothetical protein
MFTLAFFRPALALAVVCIAACDRVPGSSSTLPNTLAQPAHQAAAPARPELVTFDTGTGSLAYFTIQHGGSETLNPLTGAIGIERPQALAANGNVIIIANYQPAEVVTYNVTTKAQTTLSDPYGSPYDVAVDRQGNIYAMNGATVTVFKTGSSKPAELTCPLIDENEAIAVDNEGDVFVDGYGQSFLGVAEYPAGSSECRALHLRPTRGYISGVGVDPKTDDLIVVDAPDLCAGGINGRMVIYPRPYRQRASTSHVLYTTYCAGTFRLDASSTHIFYEDATVSAGEPIIDQARYPSGSWEGQYWEGYFGSGDFSGMTTIPNRLPN